ncbi:CsiV family protein [Aliamphritea hakodatensis]|uniref:CsiV family protein n=1 Tax=Aliamphritea hakodatensis TaxID=2895352 RepID=UPI0022FD85DB|nr:CsiV family protein [Aliamphritea hakodatensis]
MTSNLLRHIFIPLSLTLTLVASQAWAATSNYKVEVMVFSYQGTDTLDDEAWPEITSIPQVPNARSLGYRENGSGYFTRLGRNSLSMTRRQAALSNSADYRVLFHEAWIQPVGSVEGRHTIRITGGSILDNGLYELDGYISIDKGRYLHFRNNLFINRQLTPAQSQQLIRFNEPTPEALTAPEQPQSLSTVFGDTPETTVVNSFPADNIVSDFLTAQMEGGRRMRRDEVHYIDHPLMGILVYITGYESGN